MAIGAGNQAMGIEAPGAPARADDMRAVVDAEDERSQFERIRDFLSGQFGAVKQLAAEQQSAELLLELAEGELGDLKREFAAARLGPPKRLSP